MTKLPVLSGHDVLKILSKQGFDIVGRKGSHVRLKRIFSGKSYTVIVPDHKEIPIGTLKSIVRQSGLSEEYFR
ncbi:MAG: type II toxin-antitoxin system HicA family toxin [Candidatus Aenigmarchaeota archaeon]|nr:type II toxin-antitoxin system HicA family toxin [Candidatus Aenigmarchaeota archaeon]